MGSGAGTGRDVGRIPRSGRLLIRRGLGDQAAALRFLNPTLKDLPNPFLLPDLDRAVARLNSGPGETGTDHGFR
jgi:single-stranded-DNA-specific exonuclease